MSIVEHLVGDLADALCKTFGTKPSPSVEAIQEIIWGFCSNSKDHEEWCMTIAKAIKEIL